MPTLSKIKSLTVITACLLCSPFAYAQWDVTESSSGTSIKDLKSGKLDLDAKPAKTVEMQADQVQYSAEHNSAKAKGNVVLTSGQNILYADSVELDRSKNVGMAHGRVYLDSPQFKVDAQSGTFNFTNQTGTFENARIAHDPIYLQGKSVAKDAPEHMVMEKGYMTTCDHDVPHFRFATRRMDIYPGDKAVASGVKIFIGPVPVMYLSKYTQDLKDKPWFTFIPGYKKDLGYFLLTRSRIKVNPYWKMTVRVDAYERQGFAWGTENKYTVPGAGGGLVRHYFINERQIGAKHPWKEKTIPTVQNERYQVEWRHKWEIDNRTSAIWQYYRLSDDVLLPKYFQKEFRRDPDTSTYFILTRAMPVGSLTARVDRRVNRFTAGIDRTPEINYTASSVPLGSSGLYLKTNNSYSNLVYRASSPTEDRRKTMRFDANNEITFPTRIGFVQVVPMVGGENTYYSRTIDPNRTNIVRNSFKTGVDFSTRFMKTLELTRGLLGSDITRLRHIIAPSVSYRYQHKPTFSSAYLNQFDSAIDGLDKEHSIGFALENKIQGKRGKGTVELVRLLTTIAYTIRQKNVKGKLGPIKNLLEITPAEWVKVIAENTFDHQSGHISDGSLDLYFKKGDKFGFNIGDHYARKGSHQLTAQIAYVVNPKWKFRIYERFEMNTGQLKEETYEISRDLHEWETGLLYNQTRGNGSEVMMTFKLKAFPDQPFDLFGTSFHQRKAGSQSSTEGL